MSGQKVRIGVLGAGFIGKVHMNAFGAHAGSEVTGLYDMQTDYAQTGDCEHLSECRITH